MLHRNGKELGLNHSHYKISTFRTKRRSNKGFVHTRPPMHNILGFKVILRKPLFEHCDHDAILLAIQQPSLESRRQYQAALLGFQLAHETAPKHLLNTSFPKTSTTRTLRQRTPFQLPVPNTSLSVQSSPLYFASHTFNNLPPHIRLINTLPEFKRKAQQHILSYSCPCSRHLN